MRPYTSRSDRRSKKYRRIHEQLAAEIGVRVWWLRND